MKTFFNKLGFHKSDELESAIALQAAKWTWFYSTTFLFIWCTIIQIKTGDYPAIPFILLTSQNVVFFACHLIYRKKYGLEDSLTNDEE